MGSSRSNNKMSVEQHFDIPLQRPAVDTWTKRLEDLNVQFALLQQIVQRHFLPFIQPMLQHQHIGLNSLPATFLDFFQLRRQSRNKIVQPAGRVHAMLAHTLYRHVDALRLRS